MAKSVYESQGGLESVIRAYIVCALWSSYDENGEPLDNWASENNIAPETIATMREDCADFINLLKREGIEYESLAPSMLGNDFWLTRNHHGAGFWDRGMGKLGEDLTKWAHTYGSVDLYVGDDGKVYA